MFINRHHMPKNTTRSGVIPYIIKDSQLFFLLGVDRVTLDLTDFGGGIKAKESVVDAAFRELCEESCGLFGETIKKDDLYTAPAVTNQSKKMIIFFLRINPNWLYHAEHVFRNCQSRCGQIKKYNELVGVKWIADVDFRVIAFNRYNQCMWKRVQNILSFNTNWDELRIILFLGQELCNSSGDDKDEQWHLVLSKGKTRQIISA